MTSHGCNVEHLLQAHLDGELEPAEAQAVAQALQTCPECRQVLGELKGVNEDLTTLFATAEQDAPPVHVPGVAAAGGGWGRAAAGSAAGPSGAGQSGGGQSPQQLQPGSRAPGQPPSEAQTEVMPERAVEAVAAGLDPNSAPPEVRGLITSGYRVLGEIARGGFGAVYRATQISMDRPVALKVLAPEMVQKEELVARFLREARVAATLSHPNLVSIYDIGRQDDTVYYSMEFVEGEDAEVIMRREGSFPQRRAAEIVHQVAQALAAAHANQVIHRDIKPANMLIMPSGHVKLADLGLAKALDEPEDAKLTQNKKVIGSPNFMSPEQAQDLRKADHRSDLYSLGASLLHLLSGKAPFGHGSPIEILARVLREDPEIPDALPTGEMLDPVLREILEISLSKDPGDRYQTADEMVEALQFYLRGGTLEGSSDLSLSSSSSSIGRRSAKSTSRDRQRARGSKSRRQRRTTRVRRSGDALTPHRSASDVGRRSSSQEQQTRRPSGEGTVRPRARPSARPVQGSSTPPWVPVLIAASALVVVGVVLFGGGGGGQPAPEPRVSDLKEPPAPEPTPAKTGPLISDLKREEPEVPAGPTREEELLGKVEELEAWASAHSDDPAEAYRRARELKRAYADVVGGEAEGRLSVVTELASVRLEVAFAEIHGRGQAKREEGRWWEAERAYSEFIAQYGDSIPQSATALDEQQVLAGMIEERLARDQAELDRLLAAGEWDEAEVVVASIGRYAGIQPMASAREALTLAQREAPAPSVDRDAEGRQALQAAWSLFNDGKVAEAREAFERVRAEYGDVESLVGLLAGLEDALKEDDGGAVAQGDDGGDDDGDAAGEDTSDEGLLALWLGADVEALGEGRYRFTYDFSEEVQGADWRLLDDVPDIVLPAWELLGRLGGNGPEPFTVHGDRLVGYGWQRCEFVVGMRANRPVTVRAVARAQRGPCMNLLVTLRRNLSSTFAGAGYVFDWPDRRVVEAAVTDPEALRKWFRRLFEQGESTRERGMSLAVLRERGGLLHFDEDFVQPHEPLREIDLRLEIDPERDDEELELFVQDRSITKARLEPHDNQALHVGLTTLGAVVRYSELVVEGEPHPSVLRRLREAAEEAGDDAAQLRDAMGGGDD